MENVFIYLGLTFLFTWIIAFSISIGSIIYNELVHIGNYIVPQCYGALHKVNEAIQRLLTYLHM